ncbi:(2Fe-2S)-binding protein [Tepidicaulis sp. LMO-SS28]|uniref:(2Fe-2S)-binding protein n=1 Tax=Tepidicaulis sp. LMO-SS28 TaxID=3447455 RepID=UPI003EDF4E5B
MYVCSCNALTVRQVKSVAGEARGSVSAAYRALGCRPQCGKCVCFAREVLDEHRGDGATVTLLPVAAD